jgi:hypothetical protein
MLRMPITSWSKNIIIVASLLLFLIIVFVELHITNFILPGAGEDWHGASSTVLVPLIGLLIYSVLNLVATPLMDAKSYKNRITLHIKYNHIKANFTEKDKDNDNSFELLPLVDYSIGNEFISDVAALQDCIDNVIYGFCKQNFIGFTLTVEIVVHKKHQVILSHAERLLLEHTPNGFWLVSIV